jgi:cellulose synthase/poly-beta-1,6-N-acetylglucosamine synthase-like glycosyltransferase
MTEIAIAIFSFITLLLVIRYLRASKFITYLHTPPSLPTPEQNFYPNVTVILCLRGTDPFLDRCLQGLLTQDYAHYKIQIIVDSEEDPAWSVVTQVLAQQSTSVPVQLSALKQRKLTCSLKCSSLLQAIAHLDSTCEVVAFLDADTVPHATWLTELVMPLHHPQVGATSGYRWYLPDDAQWGSVVRHLWNLSAAVVMQSFHVAWGGTLALKTHVLYESGLPQLWARSLTEDVPIYQALKAKGWRISFIPSLLISNRERCDLPSFLRWSQRQSLLLRLYHPAWSWACADAVINMVSLLSVVFALSYALFTDQQASLPWLIAGLIIFMMGMAFLVHIIDQSVRQVLEKRENITPVSPIHQLKRLVAIPFSIIVCGVSTLLSQRLYRVKWRGIDYQIQDPWTIRLVEYRPYRKVESSADPMASI